MDKNLEKLVDERKKEAIDKDLFNKAIAITDYLGKDYSKGFFGNFRFNLKIKGVEVDEEHFKVYNRHEKAIFENSNLTIFYALIGHRALIGYRDKRPDICIVDKSNNHKVFEAHVKLNDTGDVVETNVTAYAPGDWEKDFEAVYDLTKPYRDRAENAEKEQVQIKEEDELRRLKTNFGIGQTTNIF